MSFCEYYNNILYLWATAWNQIFPALRVVIPRNDVHDI